MEITKKLLSPRAVRIIAIKATTGFDVPAEWNRKKIANYVTVNIYRSSKWAAYFSVMEIYRRERVARWAANKIS